MQQTGPRTRRRASLTVALIGSLLALILAQFTLVTPARPSVAARANNPAASLPRVAPQSANGVVVSQVYGGGGNSGSLYTNDFIELFNGGLTPVVLTNWSVQYANATGNTWQVSVLTGTVTLTPGQYYLVQEARGAGGTLALPAPDNIGSIALSATAGKVALVNNATPILCGGTPGSCSALPSVIDFVGFGATATDYEGSGPALGAANTTSVVRLLAGCQDLNNNAADFTTANPPTPRNTTSPLNPCVVGNTTTPTVTQTAGSATVTQTAGSATATATAAGSTATPTVTATAVAGAVRIHDIQGAAHLSPRLGQAVSNVPGIVTVRRTNGFYLQDPNPDANTATSEALFVFTSAAPTANVGDAVLVSGTVAEFRPGGSATNLTTTQISGPTVTLQSTGNPLPTPVIIGIGGRIPPTDVIEDDATGNVETSGVFDPDTDGIDFYESLEGMRVQINNAVATSPTTSFGEISVLSDNGVNASVRTTRGGILVRPTDFNPERIILDDVITTTPQVNVGDLFLAPIIGYMDYGFSNFKLEITQPAIVAPSTLTREQTTPQATDQIAIGAFNVQNLAPSDPQAKFDGLAALVVNNLKAPDIISVEEIQDNSGAIDDGTVAADQTWNKLILAISTAGGPTYQYRQIDPVNDQDGGQPGGNIRVGFLFRTDRGVAFIDRPGGDATTAVTVLNVGGSPQLSFSPGRIQPADPAWAASRKPLAAEFTYNGRKLFLVANHFRSKGGDNPLYGPAQPPVRSSEAQRHPQAQLVNNFVNSITAIDPNANIVVLGDLNDFQFSQTLVILKGTVLTDLIDTLPLPEQYTYVFDGNAQVLDHILVSIAMSNTVPITEDVVHVNSEFALQDSDHEPQVARFSFPLLTTTPTSTVAATLTATAAVPTVTATSILPTITLTILPPSATRTPTSVPSVTLTVTAQATTTQTATAGSGTASPTATGILPTITLTVLPPSATRSQTPVPSLTSTATSVADTATATQTGGPSSTTTATTIANTPTVTGTARPTCTAAVLLYGVTGDNRLVSFASNAPSTFFSNSLITGLQSGETVLGMDFRPATSRLYALGSSSRIYTLDVTTGVATAVSSTPFTPALNGTAFGFDFNPVVDRIRVVSDADQNLRLDPNTGAVAATDTVLAYATADPNFGLNPNVVGAAYTNSFSGTTTTTLYDIDSGLDNLSIQNPPNNGTLNTVGDLGADTADQVGFDIEPGCGQAFASLTAPNATASQLYRVNLNTGVATLVGTIGPGALTLRDISVAVGAAIPVPTSTATVSPTRTATATQTTVATATPCLIRFSDVTDPTAYYYQGVYYLACHGVISGYSDGTYRPFNNTTRAQMTKIVTLAFNIPLVTPPATGTFTDVDSTSVFYQLIETAAARGIVSGYTCGGINSQTGQSEPCDSARRPYFRPSNFVTRGQLTKIVVLGAGFPLLNPPTPTFTDVARDNVFYQSIETAVCHGAISGYDDHTFRPNNYAFRGQIAKIVYLAVTNPAGTCPAAAVR